VTSVSDDPELAKSDDDGAVDDPETGVQCVDYSQTNAVVIGPDTCEVTIQYSSSADPSGECNCTRQGEAEIVCE
jgi:hypothetical protein